MLRPIVGPPALLFALATTAFAEPTLERAAFQLSSACTTEHHRLLSSLVTMPGVRSVDLNSVPNHLLVDLDRQRLSRQDLAAIIGRLMTRSDCRVEPMESCISATPLSHHAHTSESPDSRDRSH